MEKQQSRLRVVGVVSPSRTRNLKKWRSVVQKIRRKKDPDNQPTKKKEMKLPRRSILCKNRRWHPINDHDDTISLTDSFLEAAKSFNDSFSKVLDEVVDPKTDPSYCKDVSLMDKLIDEAMEEEFENWSVVSQLSLVVEPMIRPVMEEVQEAVPENVTWRMPTLNCGGCFDK